MADSTATEYRYEPDLVLPPGETLAEVLDERGMTQTELAERTGLSLKHINRIVKGRAPITPDTALLLERATGLTALVWSNLEIAFCEQESRLEETARIGRDLAAGAG